MDVDRQFVRFAAQYIHQRMSHGRISCLLATHLTTLGQNCPHGMVCGYLSELTVSEQITPTIAHVDNEGPRPNDVDHCHGGTHALHLGMLVDRLVNALLAGLERLLEMFLGIELRALFA